MTLNKLMGSWSGATFILVAAAALAATALGLAGGGGAARRQEADAAARGLDKLREKYAAVESVHLSADVKLAVYGADFRVGSGAYEYWAQGDRYRIKSRTDSQLGLKTDYDIAYDGKRFYLLDHSMAVLSYRRKDEPRSVAALPNPLFLPVDYLSSDDDDCPLCSLRLPDFKSENGRWKSRAAGLQVRPPHPGGADGEVVAEMPGGKVNHRQFKLRVRMSRQGDGTVRPTLIERVDADGRIMASITFGNFAESALGQFPRGIVIKAFDDDGSLTLQAEFNVKALEVNSPLDQGVFSISFDEAESVWDSDEKRFVKEKVAGSKRQRS
jgi:hypothetical protein